MQNEELTAILKFQEIGLDSITDKLNSVLKLPQDIKAISLTGLIDDKVLDQTKQYSNIFKPLQSTLGDITNIIPNIGNELGQSLQTGINTGRFEFDKFAFNASKQLINLGSVFSQSLVNSILPNIGNFQQNSGLNLGNIASSLLGNILQFRASGGDVHTQQPYVVGEQGPELFIPTSAGHILSNNDSANLLNNNMPSVSNVYNFSINAIDSQSFIDILSQPNSQKVIANLAIKAVQKRSNQSLNRSPFE